MTIRMVAASLFLLCGAFVFAVSVVGLFRFKNTLDRIHASALSDTMGIFCTIVGLIILSDNFFSAAKLSLVVIFIWLIPIRRLCCHTSVKGCTKLCFNG